VPKCLVVIGANGASVSKGHPLYGNCAIRHTAGAFSIALKESFSSHGTVVSYLSNVRTTKALTVVQIANDTQAADDMSDHEEWISYSHWGMFTLERKSSN
jgi:hypothetical protein